MGAKLQGLELGCTSHLILGPVHPLKTSESNQLGREVANIEVHCWVAKHATLSSSAPSLTLALTWKENTIPRISQATARVWGWNPSDRWISHQKL